MVVIVLFIEKDEERVNTFCHPQAQGTRYNFTISIFILHFINCNRSIIIIIITRFK